MSLSVLHFFFDEDYYYSKGCGSAQCELSESFDYFVKQELTACTPPHVYFEQHLNELYKDSLQKECILSDWMEKPLKVAIEENKKTINSFSKENKEFVKNFIEESLQDHVEDLELFLSKVSLDTLLIPGFAKQHDYHFHEETILYIEKIFTNLEKKNNEKTADSRVQMLSIILYFAANFAEDNIHAQFVAEALTKYDHLVEESGNAFLKGMTQKNRIYDKAIVY